MMGMPLKMTAVWIGVSLVFCAGIYQFYPVDSHEKAMEFLAGYLIEKSLSMDNLFVFLMLFSFFGVERKYQHEVLFWGIFGALVLRSIFIFAGAAMVERFEWILGLFGLFLVYTGFKMFGHDDDENVDPLPSSSSRTPTWHSPSTASPPSSPSAAIRSSCSPPTSSPSSACVPFISP